MNIDNLSFNINFRNEMFYLSNLLKIDLKYISIFFVYESDLEVEYPLSQKLHYNTISYLQKILVNEELFDLTYIEQSVEQIIKTMLNPSPSYDLSRMNYANMSKDKLDYVGSLKLHYGNILYNFFKRKHREDEIYVIIKHN
jgi:hypothetical protein